MQVVLGLCSPSNNKNENEEASLFQLITPKLQLLIAF